MQYYTTLDYFSRLYDKVGRQHGADVSSREAYEAWKLDINRRLRDTIGLDLCEPAPANPRLLDVKEFENYTREHWLIQTEPLVEMPFFLLKPKGQHNGGLIMNPHGHGGGKESNIADPENPWVQEMQKKFGKKTSFAEELAAAGYYVACPDARGAGERREKWEQGEEPEKWRSNSHREINQMAVGFGMSMIGMMVWDLMRLLDYLLEAYPEINHDRVGCVGMSGGGQQTIYFSAMDERIKCAVTSGYFYGFKESLVRLPGNCSCNFAPNLWKLLDMGDLGAMIAPRPLFVESGRQDHLEGEPGLDNVYPQVEIARSAYTLLGVPDRIVHSIHEGGHQWVGKGVIPFFDKYLLQK